MLEGLFRYENDPLKHYVRTHAWLPLCKRRFEKLRNHRRLRYFTFCAVGAIDVLMLDVAKIVKRSSNDRFDTVFFFDRSPEWVIETQKRIPGACGFAGDFVDIVLQTDPNEHLNVDGDILSPRTPLGDVSTTRDSQRRIATRNNFISSFPFDVINLDLEEFLLKPRETYPGRVIQALQKVFEWERRSLAQANRRETKVNEFTLMFTTQIGPPNLGDNYLGMLRERLVTNLGNDQELSALLMARTIYRDIDVLQQQDFDLFFKLAVPKVIAGILMREDWYIDPELGVQIYEFTRPSKDGPYKILHMAMEVKRHSPPKDNRAPWEESLEAQAAYKTVVKQIFARREVEVVEHKLNLQSLQSDLNRIKARRRKYYPDQELDDFSPRSIT